MAQTKEELENELVGYVAARVYAALRFGNSHSSFCRWGRVQNKKKKGEPISEQDLFDALCAISRREAKDSISVMSKRVSHTQLSPDDYKTVYDDLFSYNIIEKVTKLLADNEIIKIRTASLATTRYIATGGSYVSPSKFESNFPEVEAKGLAIDKQHEMIFESIQKILKKIEEIPEDSEEVAGDVDEFVIPEIPTADGFVDISHNQEAEIEDFRKRIKELEDRVEELEKEKEDGDTPNFSENVVLVSALSHMRDIIDYPKILAAQIQSFLEAVKVLIIKYDQVLVGGIVSALFAFALRFFFGI